MKIQRLALTIISAAILTACGGGGDSSGTDGGSSAGPLTLTPTNYEAVATDSVSTALGVVELSSVGGLLTGAQTLGVPSLTRLARQQAAFILKRFASAGDALTGATITETLACSSGGSFTLVATDQNGNDEPDAGDSASVTFNSCVEADLGAVNGAVRIVFNSTPTGDIYGSAYALSISMTFTRFVVTDGPLALNANGTMTFNSTRTAFETGTDDLIVPSFSANATGSGVSINRSLSDLRARLTLSPTQGTTTISGRITSSSFEGKAVTLSTTTPFVTSVADAYPSSGTLVIAGADAGRVVVTATSAQTVRVDLDSNGDGIAERSSVEPWTAFE